MGSTAQVCGTGYGGLVRAAERGEDGPTQSMGPRKISWPLAVIPNAEHGTEETQVSYSQRIS
jgi:hypothetical protein